MTAHAEPQPIPRVPLILMAALVVLTLLLTASVSLGLFARQAVPAEARAAAGTEAVAERSLYFHDMADGAVRIEDAASGEQVALVAPGSGGFIRSTLRSLVHARRINGIGAAAPFALTLWDDGSLSLRDAETGRSIELGAFGKDNRATFAALLEGETG